jgi:hypothetical protein
MNIVLVHHRFTDEYVKIFTDDILQIRGILSRMSWKYDDCKFFHIKDNISLRDFKANDFEKTKMEMLWNS